MISIKNHNQKKKTNKRCFNKILWWITKWIFKRVFTLLMDQEFRENTWGMATQILDYLSQFLL